MRGRPLPRAVLLLALIPALCLAGCFVQGKDGKLSAGRQLMRGYLSGRPARITEIHVDVVRPDADKLIASDYVRGVFREDGADYEFAADTVTGEVYTSERLDEFCAAAVRRLGAQLGLDVSDMPWKCNVWMHAPAWHEENADYPWEQTYLGRVIPADADPEEWAARALGDELIWLDADLVCPAAALTEDRWTPGDTAGWGAVTVRLYGVAEGEPRPAPDELTRDALDALTGPRMKLTRQEIEYTPAE